MNHDDCPTDLVAKERRGELSPLERRALAVHLARCPSCRAWQRIGQDFDRDAQVTTNDELVVRRITEGIQLSSIGPLVRPVPASRAARPRVFRWLPFAALTTTAAAAAAVAGWLMSREMPPPEVQMALTRGVAPTASTPNCNPASSTNITSNQEQRLPDTLARDSVRLPTRPAPVASIVPVERESALSLYREASQSRRSGDVARSISIFRRLQQVFPHSPEAHLSNVALGGALLESGSAREALLQFDRYLAASANKSLSAEALYGRARTLGALHQRAEERAAWLRLSQQFPGSPYSATAARRLQSLE